MQFTIYWTETEYNFRSSQTRKRSGFLVAPPSKPVVVNQILMHHQITRLAKADLDECLENFDESNNNNTTGWGDFCDQENDRIRVSGNKELDDAVVYEHDLYKATGSIEAQCRIDAYILPCIIYKTFGEPFNGINPLRNRIPGYLWSEMTKKTDTRDILQYHTLPDLGVYIRERMVSQSAWVPSSSSSLSSTLPESKNNNPISVVGCTIMTAFSHACCNNSGTNSGTIAAATAVVVDMPDSCTSVGCIHGSIISLILGSVMPMCRRSSQCRRLYPTHPQVGSSAFPTQFMYPKY